MPVRGRRGRVPSFSNADQERYVVPERRTQWIPIAEWDVPYDVSDRELDRVRTVIEERLR